MQNFEATAEKSILGQIIHREKIFEAVKLPVELFRRSEKPCQWW